VGITRSKVFFLVSCNFDFVEESEARKTKRKKKKQPDGGKDRMNVIFIQESIGLVRLSPELLLCQAAAKKPKKTEAKKGLVSLGDAFHWCLVAGSAIEDIKEGQQQQQQRMTMMLQGQVIANGGLV
jgi:hypothetical protein